MKKVIILFVAILLLVGVASQGHARFDREEATEAGYVNVASTEHDVALVSRPAVVYAVTVWADSANAYAFLYDTTSAPEAIEKPKVEVGEATQYESTRVVFDPPIQMSTGIYADVTSGSVVVEYR